MLNRASPALKRDAAKAWVSGDYELARHLYRVCVEKARLRDALIPPSSFLSEWARLEGSIRNRESFEALYQEAIQLNPNAPFWRLCYARDTWTEFKDGAACLARVAILEELLASDRWDRSMDFAPLAYAQKIETLRAWVKGEPGGPWDMEFMHMSQRLTFTERNLLPPLTLAVKYLLPLLMPIWFPYVSTGVLKLIVGSERTGSNMLLYSIFIVAVIGTWPLIRDANKLTILNVVIIVCYYIFALVISFIFMWAALVNAFGP